MTKYAIMNTAKVLCPGQGDERIFGPRFYFPFIGKKPFLGLRIWKPDGVLDMIEVTKLNGVKILVNPDLFEVIEETPDTVITLTTGKKIIVKESRQEIKNLVKLFRKDIFA